jgi:hypothetical protein
MVGLKTAVTVTVSANIFSEEGTPVPVISTVSFGFKFE